LIGRFLREEGVVFGVGAHRLPRGVQLRNL